ncbi:MAG: NAD(P)-binding domain-containing protein, partial [Haliea sp.]|nr:NAD(P)-binding domain-containing protein [Haliea sp.]
MAHVAFIGLGNMGGPMAANLVRAGHSVTVFDLSAEACQQLADLGATVAASASEAVRAAEPAFRVDYVISMLPAGKH